MTRRPLRQFYDHSMHLDAPGDPADLTRAWLQHRRRFLDELAGLSQQQWHSPTRCDRWDAVDVIWHLITADQFWAAAIASGTTGNPTRFLVGFDPTTTPGDIAAAARRDSPTETLAAMREMNDSFEAVVSAVDPHDWENLAESPIGHVPARLALAHAFWDSWLHERDILVPLGLAPEPELDELWVVTWYSLIAAALQGGLPFDQDAVAPGPDAPFTERVSFEEIPNRTLEVSVGERVSVAVVDGGGTRVGSALEFVEYFTGRSDKGAAAMPEDLAAQLERARQIL